MASNDTLLTFYPADAKPTASNFATPDSRNRIDVLDFDQTTSEATVFTGVMPKSYAGTVGVTVYLTFTAPTATSGNVIWDVSFERIGITQDIDSDGFAAVNSTAATTVSGTSGIPVVASVAFTDGADMDSVAVGELFRLKVARNISDTLADDAELLSVEIRET